MSRAKLNEIKGDDDEEMQLINKENDDSDELMSDNDTSEE